MTKEIKKDKEVKKDGIEEIKKALTMLFSGYDKNLIFKPKYKTKDFEKLEDALEDEILFMVQQAKKDLRQNRLWLFLAGVFLFSASERKELRAQYKEIYKACKYIKKHKKILKDYVRIVKLGIFEKRPWLSPVYHSGDSLKTRMSRSGYVEKWDEIDKQYHPVEKSSFCRNNGEFKLKKNVVREVGDEEKVFEILEETMDVISEELSSLSFKGEADFRSTFYNTLKNVIYKESKTNIFSSYHRNEFIRKIDLYMKDAWKKRKEKCTENLKNSSTPKEDDSQS